MICVICKEGTVSPGMTTVTLSQGETTIVIKNVPAEVCETCGEYYLSEAISKKVYELAVAAVKKGVEVEVLRWVA